MSPGGAAGGGAAGGNLANLIVQFVTKGQQELQKSLEDIQTAIGAVVLAVQKFNAQTIAALEASKQKTKEASEQTNKLGESFKKVGDIINIALGVGVGVIANFVRQGMAAGVMGQLFGYTMERLSLTISGLFRPEIQKVLDLVNRLTTWLQNLTDAQRQQIAYWVQGAAAALAVGLVLPRIVAGIQAIIVATKALGAAIAGAEAMTGIGAILPVLGLIAQGLTALMVGTETGRAALSALWDALKDVAKAAKDVWNALQLGDVFMDIADGVQTLVRLFAMWVQETRDLIKYLDELSNNQFIGFLKGMVDALTGPLRLLGQLGREAGLVQHTAKGNRGPDAHKIGGFEDLNATYQRIAIASMRASAGLRSPEERTAENTEQALVRLAGIEGAVRGIQQPFAR